MATTTCMGTLSGNPVEAAVARCPKAPNTAPATGPSIKAPTKAGDESNPME